jgi:predicted acyltransferase
MDFAPAYRMIVSSKSTKKDLSLQVEAILSDCFPKAEVVDAMRLGRGLRDGFSGAMLDGMKMPVGQAGDRIPSIDQFRGFSILTMVAANFIAEVDSVPLWLKHPKDLGFTVIDQIAPCFIFAIGLTYGASLKRRLALGDALGTYTHFFMRAMALVGIGFFLSAGEQWTGHSAVPVTWGVLEEIGFACALCLPFLRLHWGARLGISLAAILAYQYALDTWWLQAVLGGSIVASFSRTAMLLLATALADILAEKKKTAFMAIGAGLVAAGIVLSLWFPISRARQSMPFVFLTVGISALTYFAFHLLNDVWKKDVPLLTAWGRNPLFFYILHQILLAFFVFPSYVFSGANWWHAEAPLWLAAVQLIGLLAILSLIAEWMKKKNVVITL